MARALIADPGPAAQGARAAARPRSGRASPATRTAGRSTRCCSAPSTRTWRRPASRAGPARRWSCATSDRAAAAGSPSSAPGPPASSARSASPAPGDRGRRAVRGRATGSAGSSPPRPPRRTARGWAPLLDFYAHGLAAAGVDLRLGHAGGRRSTSSTRSCWRSGRRGDVAAARAGARRPSSDAIADGPRRWRAPAHVVVVDDGFGWWPGVNAVELALAARRARVTFVTPGTAFAGGIPPESRVQLLQRLAGELDILPLYAALDVAPEGVTVRARTGRADRRASPPTASSWSASAARARRRPARRRSCWRSATRSSRAAPRTRSPRAAPRRRVWPVPATSRLRRQRPERPRARPSAGPGQRPGPRTRSAPG